MPRPAPPEEEPTSTPGSSPERRFPGSHPRPGVCVRVRLSVKGGGGPGPLLKTPGCQAPQRPPPFSGQEKKPEQHVQPTEYRISSTTPLAHEDSFLTPSRLIPALSADLTSGLYPGCSPRLAPRSSAVSADNLGYRSWSVESSWCVWGGGHCKHTGQCSWRRMSRPQVAVLSKRPFRSCFWSGTPISTLHLTPT